MHVLEAVLGALGSSCVAADRSAASPVAPQVPAIKMPETKEEAIEMAKVGWEKTVEMSKT